MSDTLAPPRASIAAAKAFFAPKASAQEFLAEWKRLDEVDKAQLLRGLADGSLTY